MPGAGVCPFFLFMEWQSPLSSTEVETEAHRGEVRLCEDSNGFCLSYTRGFQPQVSQRGVGSVLKGQREIPLCSPRCLGGDRATADLEGLGGCLAFFPQPTGRALSLTVSSLWSPLNPISHWRLSLNRSPSFPEADPEAGGGVHTRPSLGEGRLGRQSQWTHGYLLIILQFIVQDHAVGLVWLRPRQGDAVHGAAHLVHNGHGRWCCKRGQRSGVKRVQRSGVKAGMRKCNLS